tara:strand:+ start:121085 stop:121777 length:693 start_codon:yes stop_codon:yes gene_type:complete
MDDPNITEEMLAVVLEDINRANQLLNGNKPTLSAIDKLIQEGIQKSYTIMDVGCGDGTLLREIVKWARKNNYSVTCIGIDLSENALRVARKKSAGFPEIRYTQQDVLDATFAANVQCDILLCTLTMHHLYNEHIPQFLERFTKLARIGVIINDLQRSLFAYYLFKVFSTIFIKTKIAKHDGLLSIKSGFTKKELNRFSNNLKNVHHQIQWKWAFRYIWVMRTHRLTKIYA